MQAVSDQEIRKTWEIGWEAGFIDGKPYSRSWETRITPEELTAAKELLESVDKQGGEISFVPGQPGPLTKLLQEWEKKE